eukprot:Tamp_20950.p2 GENE.Tamp_20950~~Tamp_20950.p2  ORF type:complete len:139 (+),score=28.48 Tamp_20950:1-417(+)
MELEAAQDARSHQRQQANTLDSLQDECLVEILRFVAGKGLSPGGGASLAKGAEVRLTRLVRQAENNGEMGEVITEVQDSGRWGVRLFVTQRELAVKPENLIVVHAARAHPAGNAWTSNVSRPCLCPQTIPPPLLRCRQ